MLQNLIVNAALLIASISAGNQVLKDKSLDKDSSLFTKAVFGVMCGFLGILLMHNSVSVTDQIIVDFRNIAIVLASVTGGFIPAVITGLMIGAFRFFYFGISHSSMLGFVSALLIGIVSGLIGQLNIGSRQKWLYSTTAGLFVACSSLAVLLTKSNKAFKVLLVYCISIAVVSYFIMIYTEYLANINRMFRKYKEESTRDYLTDLNNVRQFDRIFNNVLDKAMENGENIALLYIDIDHFKEINDSYGHLAGDHILRQLGIVLKKTCRSFDIISRIGGEEFTVILLDCNAAEAAEAAERIRRAVEMYKFRLKNDKMISITISIGIESYPDNTIDLNNMIGNADSALYIAKRTGRNKVVLFGEGN